MRVPVQLRTGPWRLAELKPTEADAPTVFSCFHGGGGSTMGYRLAGFRSLGGVEIDPRMMGVYRGNHHPEFSYLMGIQEFNAKLDLPKELFSLDVLDGSPPCSSFSTMGNRERDWGKKKVFREGQASQVLDDLFFYFIETARMLGPRFAVAENVKGLIIGKARGYVREIFQRFGKAGYDCQLFLLNASRMGVPQARERTFFLARRRDLCLQPIGLSFHERPISVRKALSGLPMDGLPISAMQEHLWRQTPIGCPFSKAHPKGHWFSALKLDPDRPAPTLSASDGNAGFYLWDKPRRTTGEMLVRLQSFPEDFDFRGEKVQYVCGMSVPPLMMQRVAAEVMRQWIAPLRGDSASQMT